MSESTYVDLWLVYSILTGRKVNLGFLIIQHMAKVIASSKSILPYGMLLTIIFEEFGIDLDSESDVRIPKTSNFIDNACLVRLGYQHDGRRWNERAHRAPAIVSLDSIDEGAKWTFIHLHPLLLHLLLDLVPILHPVHLIGTRVCLSA